MSAFSKLHPLVLLIYFLSILLLAMFLANPVLSGIALLGGALFCATLTDGREKKSELRFYLPLFFLITVTNPLFSHNGATPLFFMNGNAVTLEAILCGAGIALMMISVMLWCKAYSAVMTGDKFLYLFGAAIPKLSLVLSVALRYLPMLKRQARHINRAQKAMGLYTSGSYADRVRSALRVFSVLVGFSLEHAVETGKSMRARGYGRKGRTNYHNFRFGRADALLFSVCAASLLAVLLGAALGRLDFAYYPRVTTPDFSARAAVFYAVFALIALLPFIIETEEWFRWNYYRSKI